MTTEPEDDAPEPQEPVHCSHVFFDGLSAWRSLGEDARGNRISQCQLCGEIIEM